MAARRRKKIGVVVRVLKFRIQHNCYGYLNGAAREVNQVWNWANETCYKALKPCSGLGVWLSAVDLDRLSAGASECFQYIGADTIQRVNAEYANKRSAARKQKLRFRASSGSKRALGWIPFKAASLRRRGRYVRFCGKSIRFFETERLPEKWGTGCFVQDAVGDWYLCLTVEQSIEVSAPADVDVGIDLGLKSTATSSDAEVLDASRMYRNIEKKIAQAQRRAHRRQAARLHRTAKRRRLDAQHKFSRKMVDRYQYLYVGDVSSSRLIKTSLAKGVYDAAWGQLKSMLKSKGQQAGRTVLIVNESYTTQTCSHCGARSGPRGRVMLDVRQWCCTACSVTHDRDVNAAINIRAAGRKSSSVSGNESSSKKAPRRGTEKGSPSARTRAVCEAA